MDKKDIKDNIISALYWCNIILCNYQIFNTHLNYYNAYTNINTVIKFSIKFKFIEY